MHGVECLRVGRYDLVSAVLALVGAHADLQLQSVEARDQKECAEREDRDEKPGSFGNERGGQEKSDQKTGDAYAHYDPHRFPDRFVFFFQFPGQLKQKLFVFFVVVFHRSFLPTE